MNHSLCFLTRISDWHWVIYHPGINCMHVDEMAGSPSFLSNLLGWGRGWREECLGLMHSWGPVGSAGACLTVFDHVTGGIYLGMVNTKKDGANVQKSHFLFYNLKPWRNMFFSNWKIDIWGNAEIYAILSFLLNLNLVFCFNRLNAHLLTSLGCKTVL